MDDKGEQYIYNPGKVTNIMRHEGADTWVAGWVYGLVGG